jgi:hypothetical protein
MNQVYTIILLVLTGLVLTAQTAFATIDYKYWWLYPDGHTIPCIKPGHYPNSGPNFTGHILAINCDYSAPESGHKWSNDPSFKQGFKSAVFEYSCFYEPKDSGCDPPLSHDAINNCHSTPSGHITNVTTCIDGHVNGFKYWCQQNTKDCASAAIDGAIPIQLVTDERYQHAS